MTRTRSQVWNHFDKVDHKSAKCIHCLRTISVSGGSVGNLLRHTKRKHPTIQLNLGIENTPSPMNPTVISMCVRKLINMVFTRKRLWDATEYGYNEKEITDLLWNEISENLGTRVEIIKSKWKNLREMYKKELKKEQDSIIPYRSNWTYFKALGFLKDQISSEIMNDDGTLEETVITQIVMDSSNYETMEMSRDFKTESENDMSMDYNKQMSQKWSDSSIKEFLSPKWKRYQVVNGRSEDMDEDMSFFNSLLPHIRKLSPTEKFQFRNEINCVMLRFICASDTCMDNQQSSIDHGDDNGHVIGDNEPSDENIILVSQSSVPE